MWKSIIVITLFVFAVFTTLSAALVQPYSGRPATNPFEAFTSGLSRTAGGIREIGPILSRAMKQVDLPFKKKELEYTGEQQIDTNLSTQDFSGRSLIEANFNGAVLSGATLRNARLENSGFEGVLAERANFSKARMIEATLSAGIFIGSDFSDANLTEVTARAAHFARAKFIGADLSFGRFSGSDFSGADLSNSYGVNGVFSNAILVNSVMVDANLRGGYFRGADLSGANLSGADVELADFSNAILTGANLGMVKNLRQEQLENACGVDVILPNGFSISPCTPQE